MKRNIIITLLISLCFFSTARAEELLGTASTTPELPSDPGTRSVLRQDSMISGVNDYKIMLVWNTSLPARSELHYRRVASGEYLIIRNEDWLLSHKAETAKLPAADYEYFVRSFSEDGQEIRTQLLKAAAKDFTTPPSRYGGQTFSIFKPEAKPLAIKNNVLYKNIKGKIILRVEMKGEAYWVDPAKPEMYYLGRPDDAFAIMRQKGIGISNADLEKISLSVRLKPGGSDADGDGLSDMFEDALATDKNKKDSDGDKYDDLGELKIDFDPRRGGGARLPINASFAAAQSGRILLATERHGEAWYVGVADKKRYFLGRPADAFSVMRGVGVGIGEKDFGKL